MTKKQKREFDTKLRTMLTTDFGAVRNDRYLSSMYELVLDTNVGLLLVQPHGDWVAMRFVDVDRASLVLHRLTDPFNPYSGKYNAVFPDDSDVHARLDTVKRMIQKAEA